MKRDSTILTQVDGIEHFSKLMNYLFPELLSKFNEVDNEQFFSFVDKINYYRDWWSDCVLYKTKHNSKVVGIVQKTPRKFYITKWRNINEKGFKN